MCLPDMLSLSPCFYVLHGEKCRKADFSIIYNNSKIEGKIEEDSSKNNNNSDNKYHL